MSAHKFPIAVRLLGLDADDAVEIAAALKRVPRSGPQYFCLHEDSLQEPDILIANGADLKAMQALSTANPGPLMPGLVLGRTEVAVPYAQLDTPLDEDELLATLTRLLDERTAALKEAKLRSVPPVPERRRRDRLDLDLTDPAVYISQRRPPRPGAVLIIDKAEAFRNHVAKLLGARSNVTIECTDNPATAVRLCEETQVAVVLINTSTPDIDPYGLCATIKKLPGSERTAVVLLTGSGHGYNETRARTAGVRGQLDKPVADRHIVSVLKKLLSLPL
jgi:CheY-like chemotaxis protein